MIRLFLPALLVLALAGCSALPGPSKPETHFVLTDPGPVLRSPRTIPGTLLLREMDASAFYQEARLAYSRTPGTRGYYQFANWSELPAKRLTWLLRARIEVSGVFATVASLGGGVVGEYQLNTRLIDFYHDASTPPGVALLIVEAELIRRNRAQLIGRQIFVAQVPVARYEAEAAADAMGRAANVVIDELTVWLEQVTAQEAG